MLGRALMLDVPAQHCSARQRSAARSNSSADRQQTVEGAAFTTPTISFSRFRSNRSRQSMSLRVSLNILPAADALDARLPALGRVQRIASDYFRESTHPLNLALLRIVVFAACLSR